MERALQSKGRMTALALATVILLAAPVAHAAPPLATMSVSPQGLEWQAAGDYEKFTLTVSGPGGVTLRREIQSGSALAFEAVGDDGKPLADGTYAYELMATPRLDAETRQALARAHQAGDEAAVTRLKAAGKLPRGPLAQSGFFTIHNGALLSPDVKEERPAAPRPTKALTPLVLKDVVTADDAIIQGSLCVGLDCVNNESFGFDTIRLKENNTRIKFDDTSTGTGFPNHDWQLTANDSASGGANKFSIEDITASTVPVTVTGSAPTNSIFVDSTGRVGFRTSTPVLDLHVNTSNTPALRLEQNNSGGFTAQTWDIAGNEANFFVRDVTGGSRLPFRIRPGAPTSSIDISADGDVGIGTASPSQKLDVECTTAADSCALVRNSSATGFSGFSLANQNGTVSFFFGTDNANSNTRMNSINNFPIVFLLNSVERLRFPVSGNVITAANGAFLSSGGTWTNASSRELKKDIVDLNGAEALQAVEKLNPVKFQYKAEPDQQHVGFIAEDVPDLVAMRDRKSLSPMDVVAVLTKVVQEQQKTIEKLNARLTELEQAKK
ncbi:MAG: tail fiber domain-containing protein [Thermoanaerobaculia bacterium]